MRAMIFHFLLIALAVLIGQRSVLAQSGERMVLVVDSLDAHPIPNVSVTVDGKPQGVTDDDGKARLQLGTHANVLVRFEHVSYRALEIRIPSTVVERGPWVVQLVPRDYQLGEVTVGRAEPEVVFQRPDLHAADLLINAAGLWVLAYEHPRMVRSQADAGKEILRDVRLVLLDTLFQEVASCPVPEDVFGLRHDLRNDVLIEGTRRAYSVGREGEALVLLPFGLDELRRAVLPWTDSIPGWVVGSNANAIYPALDHLAFDPMEDSTLRICSVVDTFMMDLFRSEYKYLKGPEKVAAMNLAADLGVEKEVVAGYMSGFSRNIWFKPLYAPLFVVGDTLLVFDHVRSRLRKFDRAFAQVGEVGLTYQGVADGKFWSGRLLQDAADQQVYALFHRNGTSWLRRIDPVTGGIGDRIRLTHAYPERVQVYAGRIYYIWRPFGSMQKRTIYRDRL